jgi:RNA polymerase sigma-70 factor (ECF subfamily)
MSPRSSRGGLKRIHRVNLPVKSDSEETRQLLVRAGEGDRAVLGELLTRYSRRLLGMLEVRMDQRLRGRIDANDVLQDAFIEAMSSFSSYVGTGASSFYLWLRCITLRTLHHAHRYHLGAQARDARREVKFYREGTPYATSETLANQLLGHLTSPSEAVVRAERHDKLKEALDSMSAMDREIVALRHFEQLSNAEVAAVLGIEEAAASKRHLRAMLRLKEILKSV